MLQIDIKQGTPEWFEARCGIPTASNFDKIITSRGAASKQAQKYMYELAGERITGKKSEKTYQSAAMLRGIELEAEARSLFEFIVGEVTPVGVCYPDESRQYACSPDGLLATGDAGLEIKCPELGTQIERLLDRKLPVEYYQQVHGSMLTTGLPFWWFMSYHPDLPLFMIKVKRDEEFCSVLRLELDRFCEGIESLVKKIKGF